MLEYFIFRFPFLLMKYNSFIVSLFNTISLQISDKRDCCPCEQQKSSLQILFLVKHIFLRRFSGNITASESEREIDEPSSKPGRFRYVFFFHKYPRESYESNSAPHDDGLSRKAEWALVLWCGNQSWRRKTPNSKPAWWGICYVKSCPRHTTAVMTAVHMVSLRH